MRTEAGIHLVERHILCRIRSSASTNAGAAHRGDSTESLCRIMRHATAGGRRRHDHRTAPAIISGRIRRESARVPTSIPPATCARERIVGTTEKIEPIALEVGYRSKKNFYRAFRALTGLTPSTCRRL